MFKIESYLSPFLLNWLNSYVKLRNEDFKLSLWEGDAVFNKLDLRLEVFQNLLRLPFNIRSGRIQELRIHIPWTKLGSEPVCLTINTIEFVLSLPTDEEKSSVSQKNADSASTEFERGAELVPPASSPAPQSPSRQPSYLEALIFKILNNVQINVNNLIVKYIEGDMIVSVNVKSAESFSADADWSKAFVDVMPPHFSTRKVANMHDATICLDRCTPSGKIESYNEPFMYRCSLQCRMLFEYPNPYSRIPSSTKLAFFFGEPEFSLADTQLPLLLRVIKTGLTVIYGGNTEYQRPAESERRLSSVAAIPVMNESGVASSLTSDQIMTGEDNKGWSNWALSYLPGVVSWTTGFQAPLILPPESAIASCGSTAAPVATFAFVGIYAKRVTFSLKLSKKHVDPLGTSSRIQFHPCVTIVATDVKVELIWRGDTFFSCSAILNSLVGKTTGFCTCHVRDEGEQVIACGSLSPSPLPCLFDQIQSSTEEIPNNADEHLQKYSEDRISEMQPAFMLDFIADSDKTREKPDAPLEELRRFQRAIFRWFVFNPTVTLTGGLFHRMSKFLGHAQKSEFDLFSSVRSGVGDDSGNKTVSSQAAISSPSINSLDFNVCGRSDRVQIRNVTIFIALNNHPSALPGKHSGIFSQRLSQFGSPLRLFAGELIVAKTEPLYPKEIGYVLKSFSGQLTEELISPCCAQYVMECSNMSLDLPSESGATFAISCGLSFSITARNFSALDGDLLKSAGLAVDFISFTMPGVSLTLNYPCLLYLSLLVSSYTLYDGRSVNAGSSGLGLTPASAISSSLEVLTTTLLGMVYAPVHESFCLSASNICLQRADFVSLQSRVISCLSTVLSSVRLDIASTTGHVIPILSFFQSDVPSAAIFVQWESSKPCVHYILASFSPLSVNFSESLNNALVSVDLTRNFGPSDTGTNTSGEHHAMSKGGANKVDHQTNQHQSAFRLLADLLASETISTTKPVASQEKSRLAGIINAIKGAVVNVQFGSVQVNLLDKLMLKVPRISASTPTGFKRLFTQQLFKLEEALEVADEEAMLWTIKLEQMLLTFETKHIFSSPLTIWATLSAIQGVEEIRSKDEARKGSSPKSVPIAQHQLSLHINVETIAINLHRSSLRSLLLLQSTVAQTVGMVSSQMSILPTSSPHVDNGHSSIAGEENSSTLGAVQFWLQVTVPRFGLDFYLDEESAKERRINIALESTTLSIDTHPLYQKIRIKFQSLHGETQQKKTSNAIVEWSQDSSFFFVTNTQLFELTSYQLPSSCEVAEDEHILNVGDGFAISITTAKVRDVFVRTQEMPRSEPVVARTTSGELFSPSLMGGHASGSCVDNQVTSGLTEVCVSLPHLDLVISQEAVSLISDLIFTAPIQKAQTVEEPPLATVFYVNSGVVRTFLDLQSHSTVSSPPSLDFLLLCSRIAVTSDIEFVRSRRQTMDLSFPAGASTTRSSTAMGLHNNTTNGDVYMHLSLEQISAYAGTWSSISRSNQSGFGRLSPHILNNPALQWNMKATEMLSTNFHVTAPVHVNLNSLFFPILHAPIDVSIAFASTSLEIIVKQTAEVTVLFDLLPALFAWIQVLSSFGDNQPPPKSFELTVLCPAVACSMFSCWADLLQPTHHFKASIARPQVIQRSGSELDLKISCQNFELSTALGNEGQALKMIEVVKDPANLFLPAAVFSSKTETSCLSIYDPINVHLNAASIVILTNLCSVVQKAVAEIGSILYNANSDSSVAAGNAHSKIAVVTDHITLSYHTSDVIAQLSCSSVAIDSSATTSLPNSSLSRINVRLEKLLSFLLNAGIRYDHCVLQPSDVNLVVEHRSFKVADKGRVQELSQMCLAISSSPVIASLTDRCIYLVNEVIETLSAVLSSSHGQSPDSISENMSVRSKPEPIFFTSHDDLRSETVRYSFISQSLVSACESGTIPVTINDPGQVFIANDGLLWAYPEPRSLTKLQLSPLPFTVQGDQEVICVLQRYDDMLSHFEPILSFRVPAEKSLVLQIEQSYAPSTAFRILLKQPIAPPSSGIISDDVDSAPPDDSVPPPATLAACCCVDSCFSSKVTPTMTAAVSLPKLEVNIVHCFPSVTQSAANSVPFPCPNSHIRYPPQRLLLAKFSDLAFKSIEVPDKGFSCDCRFSTVISCQNPGDVSYCDILDSVAHVNCMLSDSAIAVDLELHRLNFLANELLLRNIHSSINHFVNVISGPTSETARSVDARFPYQLPNTFLCNLTSSALIISDLDASMPAPDIKVDVQQCSPFHLYSIYLTSKEWPVPLSLADWHNSLEKKVVRFMPNNSHVIIISKNKVTSDKDNSSLTVLTVSSSLVVANCLNASFSVTYADGSNVLASPLSMCSTESTVKITEDYISISLATVDGFWVSASPIKLRLKTGSFAFISMKSASYEGSSAETNEGKHSTRGTMFTVVVSLIVDKIESYYHVMLVILPPFVLENDFPSVVNATLTNPHRGKVVCQLDDSVCPYPFCDIFENEMVHMTPSLASQTEDEWSLHSGPVTFSLNSLSETRDVPSFSQTSITVEKALQTVATWLKSKQNKLVSKSNILPGADVQIVSSRLFPFAPTLSLRCVPGVRIINNTPLPLVILSTDGSAISLVPKAAVCAPQVVGGIRLGYYDANTLWQSKPIDILLDVDKDDNLLVVDEENGDTEAEYRENFASDRTTLAPNRTCRVGIIIPSQNVECLLVMSSEITVKKCAIGDRETLTLTISSFLSATNRSQLVSRIACFSEAPGLAGVPFSAEYCLNSDCKIVDIPFVALTSTTTNESRYLDSVYVSLTSSSHYLRLMFGAVPFRYVTAIPSDSCIASIAVSVVPAEEKVISRSKRLLIAVYDNPFHDVTLKNMCDINIYIREKPLLYDESGNVIPPYDGTSSFCIPPSAKLELAFSSPNDSSIQFGLVTPSSGDLIWSDAVVLPSVLHEASSSINNGANIVSFGQKSVCDLQITIDNYCDTIPQVIIKTMIKTHVTKQEKKSVVVKPAVRSSSISSRDDLHMSRRSSSISRAQSPSVSQILATSTHRNNRTKTFLCRIDNLQVLLTGEEPSNPRFSASFEGLSFGASIFAPRGDGLREATSGTFQASAKRLQFDNFVDAESKPMFPVILLSSAPNDSSTCFHIQGTLLFRLGESTLTSLSISPTSFSAFIEDANMRELVECALRLGAIFEQRSESNECLIGFWHPLPLRSFSVDACSLELTIRASLYVYLAANQTPISLGAFKVTTSSLTWSELIHQMTTFYVRGAIFRAGLLVGSLNIIGRPLSLVRTTTYAVRDICYSPFSGRGILRTASTAARSVLADAILSVADFAESVGRNVDSFSARPPLSPTQQPESFFDGLKQGFTALGISLVGAIGGLAGRPIEEVLAAIESADHRVDPGNRSLATSHSNSSFASLARVSAAATRGVGLGLVGLVTQPMAGLSEFVAFTGHGLLNTVGQPNLPRVAEIQPFFKNTDHFDSRNTWYRLEDALSSLLFSGGHVVALLTTENPSTCVLLCRQTLSLFELSERTLQQTFFISDIDIVVEEPAEPSSGTHILRFYRRRANSRADDDKQTGNLDGNDEDDEVDMNKWRVEAYLASSTGPHSADKRSSNQSPPVYGLYSASLLQPKWRSRFHHSQQASSSLHQNRGNPLCSVTIRESSRTDNNVRRFLTIFYYLRDVCVSFPLKKS